MADDLQADRQTIGVLASADRRRRLLRHVEWCRKSDVFEGARCPFTVRCRR
jgi:hypothetical protein